MHLAKGCRQDGPWSWGVHTPGESWPSNHGGDGKANGRAVMMRAG